MQSPPDAAKPEIRRSRLLLGLTTAGLGALSVLVVSRFPDRIFAGDPAAYRVRMEGILEGGLPYLEVPFEHLPVMLLPMGGAWYLGGSVSQSAYIVIFAGLMTLVLAATAMAMDRAGYGLGVHPAGRRWLLMVTPLLPLVVFRNDPVAVLLALVAMVGLVRGTPTWWVWASAGSLAKVWPAALAVTGWRSGRLPAVLAGASGLVALALTRLEGFASARDAAGLHVETVVGGLVGLARTLGGGSAEVTVTTAAYLTVPTWMTLANATVGLAVVLVGGWAVLQSTDLRLRLLATGTVVAGVILTSSLFSLQYVLWLTPFLALSAIRRTRVWGFMVGLVTLGLAFGWAETILDDPIFYASVTLRNALVVAIAVSLTREVVGNGSASPEASVSGSEH